MPHFASEVELAHRVGESMFSADVASRQTMGMELVFANQVKHGCKCA